MNSYSYFKARKNIRSYWALDTLHVGKLQYTSRIFDPGVKCKIHMMRILMQQNLERFGYHNAGPLLQL
jgi:hypothetical protein